MGLAKLPLVPESRADCVGLFDELDPSNVDAGCGQPERQRGHEREQGERVRHHLADGRPILPLLTPTPIELHPEAALERQEDDRHSGQDDATDRDEIERAIVSHTVPDPSTRDKSCGHHLKDMVLPFAEMERRL
jgi:hypothetical protein